MAHERTEIRAAVVAQLIAGNTAAAGRVETSRLPPAEDAELPLLAIYTPDEATDEASRDTAPRRLQRAVDVVINAWARVPASGDIDAALDALALEIETAMDADYYFNGKARDSMLTHTELVSKTDGDAIIGCAHMIYSVTYRTDRRVAPITNAFDKVNVKFEDLDGAAPKIHATNQAEDTVSNINQE